MKVTSVSGVIACTFALVFAVGCADAPEEDIDLANSEAPAPAAQENTMASTAPADSDLLNPNDATREELLAVTALDEEAVDAILASRPHTDMLSLDAALADHLTEEEREAVYAQVWIPIDLNTASAEEILLIPGVGPQMQHEFEEYRPYQAIEQFRREIGKYVDEEEVARLEQYVTIRGQ